MLDREVIWPRLWERRDAAPALVWTDVEGGTLAWSFAELARQVDAVRSDLQAAGLGPGAQVVLVCGDCLQFFALLHACLQLGLELVPLHPDQDSSTLAQVLARPNHRLTFVESEAVGKLHAVLQGPVCEFDRRRADWLCQVPQVDAVGVPNAARAALIFHSSGSSGAAKAIRYTVEDLATFLYWQQRLFAAFPDLDRESAAAPSPRVNALPLTHWGGLSFCLQAHMDGRCLHLFSHFDAAALLRSVEESACQLLMLVPGMYREILPEIREQGVPRSLRYCLHMGESMPLQLVAALRQVPGLRCLTAYGMTEGLTGLSHSMIPLDKVPEGSCGRHCFGEMLLVGADGVAAPDTGVAQGELWVRNETVRPRYLDPAQIGAKYVDGWYRTGDWMHRDRSGNYYFVSRMDDMCQHNGRNVEPWQVEDVFFDHPDVADCVACPLKTRDGRRRMALMVESLAPVPPDQSQLLDFHMQSGSIYAAPGFIHVCRELPRLPSGKPDRRRIRRLLQEAYDASWTAA